MNPAERASWNKTHHAEAVFGSMMDTMGVYGELLTFASPFIGALGYKNVGAAEGSVFHALVHSLTREGLDPKTLADAEAQYSVFSPGMVHAGAQGKLAQTGMVGGGTGNWDWLDHHQGAALAGRTILDFAGIPVAGALGRLGSVANKATDLEKIASGIERVAPRTARILRAVNRADSNMRESIAARTASILKRPSHMAYHAARKAGLSHDEALQAKQEMVNFLSRYHHVAPAQARQTASDIMKGTSKEQRLEVWRRSYGHTPNDVPEPKSGPSLDTRAKQYRDVVRQMSGGKLQWLDPGAVHGARSPLKPQFLSQRQSVIQKLTRNMFGQRHELIPEGIRFANPDEAIASDMLRPDFDPGDQLEHFVRQNLRESAAWDSLDAFGRIGLAHYIPFLDEQGSVLTQGPKALEKVKALDKSAITARARSATEAQLGYDKPRIANRSRLGAMKQELKRTRKVMAQRAINAVSKEHRSFVMDAKNRVEQHINSLNRLYEKGVKKPESELERSPSFAKMTGKMQAAQRAEEQAQRAKYIDSVHHAVYGDKNPIGNRLATLSKRIAESRIDSEQAKKWSRAFNQNLKAEREAAKGRNIRASNMLRERQAGFMTGSELKRSSPVFRGVDKLDDTFSVNEDLARIFMDQGASSEDVTGLSRLISGYNNLYKIGVISNFVRHAFINLPLTFSKVLSPADLIRAVINPRDEDMEAAALYHANETAHPVQFGSSAASDFDTPMEDIPSFAGKLSALSSRGWAMNQHIVFNLFAHRWGAAAFAKLTRQGMRPEDAAATVRMIQGSGLDFNPASIENLFRQHLMFYPWMTGATTTMLSMLATKPQYVWAPYKFSRDFNEYEQDPDYAFEPPGTAAWQTGGGTEGRLNVAVGPQKYVKDVLDVLAPDDQINAPPADRARSLLQLGVDTLYPIESTIEAFGQTALGPPAQPGAPNFQTMYTKGAPTGVELQQSAQWVLQNKIPFSEFAQNLIGSVGNIITGNKGQQSSAAINAVLTSLTLNPYQVNTANGRAMKKALDGFHGFSSTINKYDADIYRIQHDPTMDPQKQASLIDRVNRAKRAEWVKYSATVQLLQPGITPQQRRKIIQGAAGEIRRIMNAPAPAAQSTQAPPAMAGAAQQPVPAGTIAPQPAGTIPPEPQPAGTIPPGR
jgi:hypothetical protein